MPEWQKKLRLHASRCGGEWCSVTIGKEESRSPNRRWQYVVDMEAIKSTVKRGTDIIEPFLSVLGTD